MKRSGQWQPPAAAQACPAVAARWPQFTSRGWVGGRGLEVIFLALHKSPGPKMSSHPPPAGRGAEKQLSPCMEPPAWGWGPKAWKFLEASSWLHSLKVGQPFSTTTTTPHWTQTEGPASPWRRLLLSSNHVDPSPCPRQPWASWGPLMAPNASPPLASVHPPEKQPWRTERISAPHRTRSGRRAGGDF